MHANCFVCAGAGATGNRKDIFKMVYANLLQIVHLISLSRGGEDPNEYSQIGLLFSGLGTR
jgi:hypothetical protein